MNKTLTIIGLAATVLASVIVTGCGMFSKQVTTTPGYTNSVGTYVPPVTTTNIVVNTNELSLYCSARQLIGVQALIYACKDPAVRPILVNTQIGLNAYVNGVDTNAMSKIDSLIGKNTTLDAAIVPLVQGTQAITKQFTDKYGAEAGVVVGQELLKSDLKIVNAVLAAVPEKQ